MWGQGYHRHAGLTQGLDGLGGQVRIGAVDDGEVGDSGARRRDHLREVGAAPDDGERVRAGLDRLDDGGFVSLVDQERDPVDGAHGDPTGTAARESAEV